MNKGKELFTALVAAHEEGDDAEIDELRRRLVESGAPVRVSTSEDIEWSEPDEVYGLRAPLITQDFQVYVGDELAFEGWRQFGSELEDRTHTGVGGNWVTFRVDENGTQYVEEALEALGVELDWPDAPAWSGE